MQHNNIIFFSMLFYYDTLQPTKQDSFGTALKQHQERRRQNDDLLYMYIFIFTIIIYKYLLLMYYYYYANEYAALPLTNLQSSKAHSIFNRLFTTSNRRRKGHCIIKYVRVITYCLEANYAKEIASPRPCAT